MKTVTAPRVDVVAMDVFWNVAFGVLVVWGIAVVELRFD
jgi:hypothetical protein